MLKNVLKSKLVTAQVYDIIDASVQPMILRAGNPRTRQLAAEAFLYFLFEYPIESSRLDQHISFVVKNLGYGDLSGRESLLSLVEQLATRLPEELAIVYGELLFFSLLLRTVNEPDPKCKRQVFAVLTLLIGKLPGDKARSLLNSVLSLGADKMEGAKAKQMRKTRANGLVIFSTAETFKFKQVDVQSILATV